MGLFSRIKSAAARVVERVASTVERAAARVLERVRPVVAEKPAPRAPTPKPPKPPPSPPRAPPPPPPTEPARAERAALVERLGPVLDELEPSDEWPREAIELDQWFAYLDDAQEHLPRDFTQELRDLIASEGWGLDDDLITSIDMDAPDGDTP